MSNFSNELKNLSQQGYKKQIEEINELVVSLQEKLAMECVEPLTRYVKYEIKNMAKLQKIEEKNGEKYINYVINEYTFRHCFCRFSQSSSTGLCNVHLFGSTDEEVLIQSSKFNDIYDRMYNLYIHLPCEERRKCIYSNYEDNDDDGTTTFILRDLLWWKSSTSSGKKLLPFLKCGTVTAEYQMNELSKKYWKSVKEILEKDGIEITLEFVPNLKPNTRLEYKTFDEKHIVRGFCEDCMHQFASYATKPNAKFKVKL